MKILLRGNLKPPSRNLRPTLLYPLVAVLLILWMLGMFTSYALGGFIHILLVVALVLFIVRLTTGKKRL